MPIIVGLGNVGNEYGGTRHNIGFEIVDYLAQEMNLAWEKGPGPYYFAKGRHRGRNLILVKPTTLMNRSGKAITNILAHFDEPKEQILVVYDDLNLETGQIRLRKKGSDGGHNGLKDIIDKLQSGTIPRLRFGIGDSFPRGRQVDYVLSPFTGAERSVVDEQIPMAADACLTFAREGIDQTMNKYN